MGGIPTRLSANMQLCSLKQPHRLLNAGLASVSDPPLVAICVKLSVVDIVREKCSMLQSINHLFQLEQAFTHCNSPFLLEPSLTGDLEDLESVSVYKLAASNSYCKLCQ